jgi:AcrR family transcriptional regulator
LPRPLSDEDLAGFRERLIDAAERLFAVHGLEAVTMRQLAAEIGVSPMTPYRYFADKDAILAAVRARAFNRHAEALEAAFEAARADPVKASRAVGEAYVAFAMQHPEAYKLMFDVTQPSEKDYPELVEAAERSRRTMTQHVKGLAGAGLIAGDEQLIAHMYWAAVHGPLMLQFSGKLAPGFQATRLIPALVDALDRALSRRP